MFGGLSEKTYCINVYLLYYDPNGDNWTHFASCYLTKYGSKALRKMLVDPREQCIYLPQEDFKKGHLLQLCDEIRNGPSSHVVTALFNLGIMNIEVSIMGGVVCGIYLHRSPTSNFVLSHLPILFELHRSRKFRINNREDLIRYFNWVTQNATQNSPRQTLALPSTITRR